MSFHIVKCPEQQTKGHKLCIIQILGSLVQDKHVSLSYCVGLVYSGCGFHGQS